MWRWIVEVGCGGRGRGGGDLHIPSHNLIKDDTCHIVSYVYQHMISHVLPIIMCIRIQKSRDVISGLGTSGGLDWTGKDTRHGLGPFGGEGL